MIRGSRVVICNSLLPPTRLRRNGPRPWANQRDRREGLRTVGGSDRHVELPIRSKCRCSPKRRHHFGTTGPPRGRNAAPRRGFCGGGFELPYALLLTIDPAVRCEIPSFQGSEFGLAETGRWTRVPGPRDRLESVTIAKTCPDVEMKSRKTPQVPTNFEIRTVSRASRLPRTSPRNACASFDWPERSAP